MKLNSNTPDTLEIDGIFADVLCFIENSDESAFITGRAGTGKSTLLNLVRDKSKKRVAVLSPTGIAAINIGGQTIHSFFGLPHGLINKIDIEASWKRRELFKNLDTLIIDDDLTPFVVPLQNRVLRCF